MSKPRYTALCLLSALLTAAGFFLASVPFVIAYLPFAFAILVGDRGSKASLATGHYIWPAIIAAWGLIQLGYSPLLVLPLGLCFSALVGWLSARFTVGGSAMVLGAIPFIPDNPLLVTGSVLPNLGVLGLLILATALIWIERQRDIRFRAGFMTCLVIFAVSVQWITPTGTSYTDSPMQEVDISVPKSITRTGHWARIGSNIDLGETVILGENIFEHTDDAAISYWCRVARDTEATLFIGVQGPQSVGEVWEFSTATCPTPSIVYRAVVGIPNVTGGWLPNMSNNTHGLLAPSPNAPQWLACFEGFSLFRWIGVDLSQAQRTIVISNDKWTEPFPVWTLRRKVGNEFAKLYGIEVIHAEAGRSFLAQAAKHP